MSINNGGVPPKYKRVKRGSHWALGRLVKPPNRYKTLFSLGMRMKKEGVPTAKIVREVERAAKEECEPPYVGKQLDRLIHQIVVAYEEE
jgi:hypothetical protein